MRKEYSDLSDKQKLVYIKRNVIIGVCTMIPIIIFAGAFITLVGFMAVPSDTIETTTNSTSVQVEGEDSGLAGVSLFFVGMFVAGMYGLMFLGADLGAVIANHFNLYTDFDLERKQKELDKIKEALK